jgi:hypothetical protein
MISSVEQRERPEERRRDREPIRDQCGCVVDQTLPLEDRHDPGRGADPPEDRGGGHGVRRRDDRAESKGRGESHRRDEHVDDGPDDDRCEQHQPDREERDRPCVGLDVADRGREGSAEEDRREQQKEDDVGLELDRRETGHEAEHQSAGDQQDRIRDTDTPRQVGQGDDDHEQAEDQFDRSELEPAELHQAAPDSSPESIALLGRRPSGRAPAPTPATPATEGRRCEAIHASSPGISSGSNPSADPKPKTWPRNEIRASSVRRRANAPRKP